MTRLHPEAGLYDVKDALACTLIDQWLDVVESELSTTDFKALDVSYKKLNKHLTLRSYIIGYKVTAADFAVWGALRASPVFSRIIKTKKETLGAYLVRWYEHILSSDAAEYALTAVQKQDKSSKVSMSIYDKQG